MLTRIMYNTDPVTQYLSPQKSPDGEIRRQKELFRNFPLFNELCDAVSDIVAVLNANRQIVAFNNNLLEQYGFLPDRVYGLRPGELLDCVHAANDTGGCGTAEFCRMCGAANAFRESRDLNRPVVKECRIRRKSAQNSLDLKVKAAPFRLHGEDFTVFALTDIGHEKRRKALERVFYHDILNLAGNVENLADLARTGFPEKRDRYIELIRSGAAMMIDEIMAQKQLTAAENDELTVDFQPVDSLRLTKELAEFYSHHKAARGKILAVEKQSVAVEFTTDKALLSRVLGNMVKNALEACEPGEQASIGCLKRDCRAIFHVRNPAVIAPVARLQIFQRSFSTKSRDRGLGTYSMKLLGEKYLEGKISFVSDRKNGTVFTAAFPVRPMQGRR